MNQIIFRLPLDFKQVCLIYFDSDCIFVRVYTKDRKDESDVATNIFIVAATLRLRYFIT